MSVPRPDGLRKRRLTEQESPTVAPVLVTQLTSLAVLGIPGRRFREFIPRRRVRHTRVGKLVVAEIADVLEALRAETPTEVEPANDQDVVESQPETADEVLACLGRRRTG